MEVDAGYVDQVCESGGNGPRESVGTHVPAKKESNRQSRDESTAAKLELL